VHPNTQRTRIVLFSASRASGHAPLFISRNGSLRAFRICNDAGPSQVHTRDPGHFAAGPVVHSRLQERHSPERSTIARRQARGSRATPHPSRRARPSALTLGRVQRRKQQDPRGPWDEDGSDYCHTSLLPRLSARLARNFREISPPRTENPREPESRCRLTCRTESSRSNTTRMRPGSHVPVSFVSLLVTGTIAIPRISSFYPIAPGGPGGGCRRTRRAKCYLPYRRPRAINAARFSRRFSRAALISRTGLRLPCCDSLILSPPLSFIKRTGWCRARIRLVRETQTSLESRSGIPP